MPFAPKRSTRLSPNVSLRLTDRCLVVTTQMLTKLANERANIRNAREKKSVRRYLYNKLPASLHQEILQKAVELSLGAQSILNLLDLFEPAQDARDKVDLVGPSSLRIGCWRAGHSRWFIRSLTDYNLTVPQLDQLYNILIWSNPSELREIALSASNTSLKASKIPNILARGRALTKVTLLEGADNHILRILGMNCPRLKHLDVSHSHNVTTQGLLNLLLSRPPRNIEDVFGYSNGGDIFYHARLPRLTISRSLFFGDDDVSSYKKNPCVETIVSIKVLCTPLEKDICGPACVCEILGNSYKFLLWPFTKIVRILEPKGLWEKGIALNPETRRFPSCAGLSDEVITAVSNIAEAMLDPWIKIQGVWSPTTVIADHLIIPMQKPTDEQKSLLFIKNTFGPVFTQLRIHIKVERVQFVTSLVSDLTLDFTLDQVGHGFPHLRHFRGTLIGVWNFDRVLLPNLVVISLWCNNSTTVLSIIQHAPSIKLCEFNILQWDPSIPDDNVDLHDFTFEDCLKTNRRLSESLEEIVIQPCWLTVSSLRALVNNCPNMKIIGDLQSWKITSRQIESVNKYLDRVGSQCVLSVMNFPQPRIQNVQWL